MSLRKFESPLEGHPTMKFKYTEAATGSLGQGLSIGVGIALNAKMEKLPYKTFVLLGDSEMAEGSVWEAMQIAAHYKLENLVGILDVNRLGQRGETMYGHRMKEYEKRIKAFCWKTIVVDGHNLKAIERAYVGAISDRPYMIIAKTIKGKGVRFLEDKDGWHGKALPAVDLEKAVRGLGKIDLSLRGTISKPAGISKSEFLISKQYQNPNKQNSKHEVLGIRIWNLFRI
jgi:transketolase